MIFLSTARLILRDHRPSDLDSHHALLSDPASMHYMTGIQTRTPAESQANLQASIDEIDSPARTCYFLRMEHHQTGAHLGEIGYTVTERTPLGKLAGIGYFIHRVHWGNGYTPEALQELLRFGFEEDDVYRFHTGCLKENTASARVMQKCGMTKEAEFKEYQWHDGRLKDRVEYRLLKSEWLAARGQ